LKSFRTKLTLLLATYK